MKSGYHGPNHREREVKFVGLKRRSAARSGAPVTATAAFTSFFAESEKPSPPVSFVSVHHKALIRGLEHRRFRRIGDSIDPATASTFSNAKSLATPLRKSVAAGSSAMKIDQTGVECVALRQIGTSPTKTGKP